MSLSFVSPAVGPNEGNMTNEQKPFQVFLSSLDKVFSINAISSQMSPADLNYDISTTLYVTSTFMDTLIMYDVNKHKLTAGVDPVNTLSAILVNNYGGTLSQYKTGNKTLLFNTLVIDSDPTYTLSGQAFIGMVVACAVLGFCIHSDYVGLIPVEYITTASNTAFKSSINYATQDLANLMGSNNGTDLTATAFAADLHEIQNLIDQQNRLNEDTAATKFRPQDSTHSGLIVGDTLSMYNIFNYHTDKNTYNTIVHKLILQVVSDDYTFTVPTPSNTWNTLIPPFQYNNF
jgi:hypothetical protein